MAKLDDISNNFEEQRKKVNEKFGSLEMPIDTKGRIITGVILAILLITVWQILEIAIVTFILTFVFYHLQKYALRGLAKTPFRIIPAGIVLLLIYAGVITLIVLFVIYNKNVIQEQLTNIVDTFTNFDLESFAAGLDPNLAWLLSLIDINAYLVPIVAAIRDGIASFGLVAFNFVISMFLSFLFVLEKKKITMIGDSLMSSRVAYIYRYFLLFAGSFCYTFGKVMKVQVIIAAVNCAITTVFLSVLEFPYILVLSITVFVLGLIPVAGVFISLVPLAIIAFSIGGLIKVLQVLIMIAVIHAVEAYFLNPKLMSRRTSLPVSLVFVVLIISERYLGVWGMLIGVPLFIYVMNVLNVDYRRAMEDESHGKLWKSRKSKTDSSGNQEPGA